MFICYRLYQQAYGWSAGLDVTQPEFEKYWMTLVKIQLPVLFGLCFLCWGYLWMTRDRNMGQLDRRVELRRYFDPNFPHELVARKGLILSDDSAIEPGQTKAIKFEATDAAWEIERLTSFLSDVDSKFGGLLFLFDDAGKRYIAEIGAPILPVFRDVKIAAKD